MTYPTTPREIADALQVIVDDLRAMPQDELPPMTVAVDILPHGTPGTPEERMRVVDLIGWHLTGATGETNESGNLYSLPYEARMRQPGVSVSVLTDPRGGDARPARPQPGRRRFDGHPRTSMTDELAERAQARRDAEDGGQQR